MILVDGGGCKMANPFHSTGSPIVDRMCRLQFTGNVIPAAWYRTITSNHYFVRCCVLVSAGGNPR